jgi:hypothetical protein
VKPAQRNKLFNALADAYAEGRASWLFLNGQNQAVQHWCAWERGLGLDDADSNLLRLVKETVFKVPA